MFDDKDPASPDHSTLLGILARADGARLAAFAETLLPDLGDVAVIQSRTGLVMLPMRDTVQGTDFHLGEVLVAAAHIRAGDGTEGYGIVIGRDLTRAMAMAVVDASAARAPDPRIAAFLRTEAAAQAEADTARLRDIEATRVDMETF